MMHPMRRYLDILCESRIDLLTIDAIDLIDAVMDAKLETGESFDGDEDEERDRVHSEIVHAQRDLGRYVKNGEVAIHRALAVAPTWLEQLKPGAELGTAWSYAVEGAFAYNGRAQLTTVVISGTVSAESVNWLHTIALHSAGEAEIRVYPDAEITVTKIGISDDRYHHNKLTPARPDLSGAVFLA